MLLLNIQFWNGDREQAMALARLIADIETDRRDDVTVMFTARFDAKHDEETIKYVSKKFPVIRFTGKRKDTGWPAGPNQMVGESYEYLVEAHRNRAINQDIDAVLFVEADCVPLHKDWINMLYKEYKDSGKMVSGAWLKKADAGIEHVNGNCIISMKFWRVCPQLFWPPNKGGWDALLATRILPYAHPSKLIWSDYQLGQAHNPWKGCNFLLEAKRYGAKDNALYGQDLYPVWFHGIKVTNGLECARKHLVD